jgi:spermidine synthase
VRAGSRALSALVFVAGIGTLAVEISASRLLAPYYGSSTIVWANLIALVLASLSLGYWLGGRLADRRPEARVLGALVLAAAVWIAATPFVARPFLDVTVEGIDEASAGAAIGSFFATLGLFAPSVTLLGMVAPFAIRLALDAVEAAGSVAGRLYALSTVGSLLGTFLSALVAIPLIGTQRTLLLSAALLALVGAALVGRRWLLVPVAVAALAGVPPGAIKADDDLVYETESHYQYIQVVQRGEARYLRLNEGVAVHSVWRPDTVLTGGEWDMFLLVPALLGRPVERVAILGNAAGTIARAYGVFYPRAEIDGVELDPDVSRVGRRWFGLGDNPRLHVRDADARPFLAATDRRYDLIVVDAYRQPYIPFYLATREFFRLARERLRPGGIVALNVASVPRDRELARSIAGTLAAEVPQVWTWKPLRFNQLVLGFARPVSRDQLAARVRSLAPRIRVLGDVFARDVRPAARIDDPWTDDRAPVEWITDRMILEFAAAGGELDEEPLPTDPDR